MSAVASWPLVEAAEIELPGIEVAVLGPVTARAAEQPIRLGGPKDRALLAQLALAGGRSVSESALVDGIWGEAPPERAAKLVQNQVLRVRKAMRTACAGPVIITEPGGYRLELTSCVVDLHRAEALIDEARRHARRRDHERAAHLLGDALAHWRGEPLADLSGMPFAIAATARLGELRWLALEERVDADLACGRHQQLVAELYQAVHDAPLRERLWGQLMVALYRSGRQAEALRTFQHLRRHLDAELGLVPGAELAAIERAIATGTLPMSAAETSGRSLAGRAEPLRAVRLFADAGPDVLERVASAVVELDLDPGDVLTREGEEGHEAYVILDGEATVTIAGTQVACLGPGEVVGEMALIDGSTRVATVTACSPMRVLLLERETFGGLLGERSIAARLLGSVVARLRALEAC